MALIILNPGDTFGPVGGFQSDSVIGTNGSEVVIVAADGVVTFDSSWAGGDTIRILGNAADYDVEIQQSDLVITSDDGAEISIPIKPNGATIEFLDADRQITIKDGEVCLGDQVIEGAPEPVNAGDNGGGGGNGGGEGDTILLTTGRDILNGTSGDDTFDGDIAQNSNGEQANTLGTGDRLNGGAGYDTLLANVQNASALNGEPGSPITPRTTSIEEIVFKALPAFQGSGGFGTEINASEMLGVSVIGSGPTFGTVGSEASLYITNLTTLDNSGLAENARSTESITICMDHTSSGDTFNPAADLIVLFDQDYLINEAPNEAGASLTLQLLDIDNEITSGLPLLTNPFDSLRFTLTVNGVSTTYTIAFDGQSNLSGAAAYQEIVESLNAGLAAAGLDELVATVNGPFTVVDPDGSPGGSASGFEIIITNTGAGTLDPVGFLATGVVPPNTDYQKEVFPTPPENDKQLVTSDICLDKVGSGGEGGHLIVGGEAGGSHDIFDLNGFENVYGAGPAGVGQFDITVRGISNAGNGLNPEDSSLASLQSTNNSLECVFIESADGITRATAADLTIGNANTFETANGALKNAYGAFSYVHFGLFPGLDLNPVDLTSVRNNALKDVIRLDTTGENDQGVGAFLGDLTVYAYFSDEVVDKYLDVVDTQPVPDADNVSALWTTGVGNDLINVNIEKSNLVSIGSATRDDFAFNLFTNGGDDHVQIQIGNGFNNNFDPQRDPDLEGPPGDTDLFNTTNWYQNHVLSDNLQIVTGSGNDFVETWGATAARIDLGDGNDAVFTDNSGEVEALDPSFDPSDSTYNFAPIISSYNATWVFNAQNTTIYDLRSELAGQVTNVANLTLTVTFQGIEVTVQVGDTFSSTGATVNDLTINQAIKDAINNDEYLSDVLVAEDGPGRTLVVRSLIDGLNNECDLEVNLGTGGPLSSQQSAAGARLLGSIPAGQIDNIGFNNAGNPVVGQRFDSTFATQSDFGPQLDGNDSVNVNNNIVEMGLGDDTTVLSSNGGSVETIDIDGVFDDDVIFNFTASIGEVAQPEVQTFVVSGDATGPATINGSAMGIAFAPINVAAGQTETQIADALQAALQANAAGNYTVSRTGNTITVTDADGTIGNDEPNATLSVSGVNEQQQLIFNNDDIAVGQSVTVTFGGETASYTLTAQDLADAGGAAFAAEAVAIGLANAFNTTTNITAGAGGQTLTLTNDEPGNIPTMSVATNSNIDYTTSTPQEGQPVGFTIVPTSVDGQVPAIGYDIFDLTDAAVLDGQVQGFVNNTADNSEMAVLTSLDLSLRNVAIIDRYEAGDPTTSAAATTEAGRIQADLRSIDGGAGENTVVFTIDNQDPNLAHVYLAVNGSAANDVTVSKLGTIELGVFCDPPEYKDGIGIWEEMSITNFTVLSRNELVQTFEAYNSLLAEGAPFA